MRQWSVDSSSENAFSPFLPFSPPSQRSTTSSLRSIPTNIDSSLVRKSAISPSSAFPSAPADWNQSRGGNYEVNYSNFPSETFPQHVRVLSRGVGCDSGQRHSKHERTDEEEEGRLESARLRLLPPASGNEDDEEEDGSPRGARLSRHIPQREGMDMSVSAFNLLDSDSFGGSAPTPLSQQQHQLGSLSAAAATSALLTGPRASRARATAGSAYPGQQPHIPAFLASTLPTPSVSTTTSFTESQVSDDSSYMASLYNDMLADNLTRGGGVDPVVGAGAGNGVPGTNGSPHMHEGTDRERRPRGSDGSSSNGRGSGDGGVHPPKRGGLGGEVFRFGAAGFRGSSGSASPRGVAGDSGHNGSSSCPSSADRRHQHPSSRPGSLGGASGSVSLSAHTRVSARRRAGVSGGGVRSERDSYHGRVLCTNPERVLDAPEFPANNSAHLIDWGSNNKLIIGLKSSLYAWDGETGSASKMVDLQGGLQIDCVQWLQKCACVALSVGGGTVAIYDCRSEDFVRTVRLPAGNGVTGVAVNGPVLAVSSSGPTGLTQAFDLRAKNALVATYEGHAGPITALQYCSAEPYYLATGGQDGHVRIWDSRRSQAIRYAYDSVHQGKVTALHWNPDRRSRLFTGGEDGVLCLIDTHAAARPIGDDDGLGDEDNNRPVFLGWGDGNSNNGLGGNSSSGGVAGGLRFCGGAMGGDGGGATNYFITRAVKSMFPISGMSVCNGEVVTSHRGQGQLQLRKVSSFQLLGVFSAPNCCQGLSCLSLSPDRQVVCAAQEDETVKFWRVFGGPQQSSSSGSHTDPGPASSRGRPLSHRGETLGGGDLPTRGIHRNLVSRLDEQLR